MNKQLDKKPELVEMGKKLKELRDINGKSQKEAAGDLGLKPSVLSSYELGDREPPYITLNKIARYYNVTVDYLTGNSEFPSPQHEKLNSIFSDKTITKIRELPERLRLFLDESINDIKFLAFLSGLEEYKNVSQEDLLKLKKQILDTRYNEAEHSVSKTFFESAIENLGFQLDTYSTIKKKFLRPSFILIVHRILDAYDENMKI